MQHLLKRAPIDLDWGPLRFVLERRRVMVTGASGSIGSELCRTITRFQPASLCCLDRAENGLVQLGYELDGLPRPPDVHLVVADVREHESIDRVMHRFRPNVVFHAAAHKHVPLMEANPCEAVTNNVTGTRLLAELAERHGVDRFVLISTDKAVNPTSVMGATKRVAELLVHVLGSGSRTRFMGVRFGNVLGSNGSAVPLFIRQIDEGGPVTVTHPDAERYFMLTTEAVQLVLYAAARGESGSLYVPDLGEQVKVLDLARDLIRLYSGHVPGRQIPISFTGLRPGEKLSEEVLGEDERDMPTSVEDVRRVTPRRAIGEGVELLHAIDDLGAAARMGDEANVIRQLCGLVPAFGRNRRRSACQASVPRGAA